MVKTILYFTQARSYLKTIGKIIHQNVILETKLIYVPITMSVHNLSDHLEKENVKTKDIFFIDCISHQIGTMPKK